MSFQKEDSFLSKKKRKKKNKIKIKIKRQNIAKTI